MPPVALMFFWNIDMMFPIVTPSNRPNKSIFVALGRYQAGLSTAVATTAVQMYMHVPMTVEASMNRNYPSVVKILFV